MANAISPNVLNQLNQTSAAAQPASNSEEMRNNFMTLLVTQLQNQDPLNPMENNEMTSQLAQINTVSGIESLNDTMQNINGQIEANKAMQASNMIGRAVLVPGQRILVGGEGTEITPYGFSLDQPADDVKVNVFNASGMLVRQIDLGSVGTGTQTFTWDGQMLDGNAAPEGMYTFAVEAKQGDQAVTSETFNYAQVIAVSTSAENGVRLDLGGIFEPVRLEDVRQII
ncbi:Basal-body rod modification protein FlgD [Pseudidiomarina piscicola]|uniref:Basal-body rod modification protein FlgD n=1 Tax=Pseudidiomarina piscicola TaxID=2614830 RepID=A0A6S6WLZ3_9GAMM|nr:flagellar hook assembly protein FlgD [Pseudidiomarina piscicola]CAB0151033.1 Basal-body rod modification protein FlgD [Pseudidiomarina piscicola]VZT40544.1 Basal-body rod modification protein FlgD [Pseudomonas aeruginosa]